MVFDVLDEAIVFLKNLLRVLLVSVADLCNPATKGIRQEMLGISVGEWGTGARHCD